MSEKQRPRLTSFERGAKNLDRPTMGRSAFWRRQLLMARRRRRHPPRAKPGTELQASEFNL